MRNLPQNTTNFHHSFGMSMQSYSNAEFNYSYGMNTQEKDDEIYGKGNSYSAEYWQYDARLGRRWNSDPRPNASISIYACFMNNPIWFSDVDGDTTRYYDSRGKHLHTSNDGLNDAIVEIAENNVDEFLLKLEAATEMNINNTDNVNTYLRSFGYVYELDQFRSYYNEVSEKTVDLNPYDHGPLTDIYFPHNGQTVLYAEYRKYMFLEMGNIVLKGDEYTDCDAFGITHLPEVFRNGAVSDMHTHPNSYPFYINYKRWDQRLLQTGFTPSETDIMNFWLENFAGSLNQYVGNQKKTVNHVRYKVVVDALYIHFYKSNEQGQEIIISINR